MRKGNVYINLIALSVSNGIGHNDVCVIAKYVSSQNINTKEGLLVISAKLKYFADPNYITWPFM